jgi:hypothetical protein
MASATDSPSGLDSTSSLEIALDQAIARRFAAAPERAGKKRRNTPTPRLPTRLDRAHTPTEKLARQAPTALALTSRETSLMRPPARLRWKGIEVSDEFQEYAARVARGEELEPYRGAVLSRPCAEFPWGAAHERRTLLPPPRGSQRPSLVPVSVPVHDAPESEPAAYPERGRGLKTALWVAGALSSIIGALGVGAGATNNAGNDFDDLVPDPSKLADRPSPAATALRDEALVSNRSDAPKLEGSIGARQLASLAADDARAEASAKAAAPKLTTAPAARPLAAPLAAHPQPPAANAAAADASPSAPPPSSKPSSASRLAIPPPGPLQGAGELSHGIVTTARPAEPQSGISASDDSALFSDRAPF